MNSPYSPKIQNREIFDSKFEILSSAYGKISTTSLYYFGYFLKISFSYEIKNTLKGNHCFVCYVVFLHSDEGCQLLQNRGSFKLQIFIYQILRSLGLFSQVLPLIFFIILGRRQLHTRLFHLSGLLCLDHSQYRQEYSICKI